MENMRVPRLLAKVLFTDSVASHQTIKTSIVCVVNFNQFNFICLNHKWGEKRDRGKRKNQLGPTLTTTEGQPCYSHKTRADQGGVLAESAVVKTSAAWRLSFCISSKKKSVRRLCKYRLGFWQSAVVCSATVLRVIGDAAGCSCRCRACRCRHRGVRVAQPQPLKTTSVTTSACRNISV